MMLYYDGLNTKNRHEIILQAYLRALEGSKGCCILHIHTDLAFWDELAQIIPALTAKVKHIYLEWPEDSPIDQKRACKLNEPHHAEALAAMVQLGEADPDSLNESHPETGNIQNISLGRIFEALSKTEITLYFVDDPERDSKRIEERNNYMVRCIGHLCKELQDDEKYLVIAGAGHDGIAGKLGIVNLGHFSQVSDESGIVDIQRVMIFENSSIGFSNDETLKIAPQKTIITPFSLFQPKANNQLMLPIWIFTQDVIKKMAYLQSLAHLGITVELGKKITVNPETKRQTVQADETPTIRMTIRNRGHKNSGYLRVQHALEQNRFAKLKAAMDAHEANLTLSSELINLVFRRNRGFKDFLGELGDYFEYKDAAPTLICRTS